MWWSWIGGMFIDMPRARADASRMAPLRIVALPSFTLRRRSIGRRVRRSIGTRPYGVHGRCWAKIFTGFSAAIRDTARTSWIRSGILPNGKAWRRAVGACEPRWFMQEQHVDPAEAVQIHVDLRAKRSVGVHWGTFALADEPLDHPIKALAAARAARGVSEEAFALMAVGETRRFPPRE